MVADGVGVRGGVMAVLAVPRSDRGPVPTIYNHDSAVGGASGPV